MKPFVVTIFMVLATIAVPIFSISEDRFKKLFEARTPVKEIIAEVMPSDPITTYKHFQVLQDHIKKNDEYASYAKTLKSASQKILDGMLREINYKEKVNIEKYIDAAKKVESGSPVSDRLMVNLIEQLKVYRRQLVLDVLEEAEKMAMQKILKHIDNIDVPNNDQTEITDEKQTSKQKKSKSTNSKPRRIRSKTPAEKTSTA